MATPTVTQLYKIVVTSDNGCRDSAEVEVIVDSLPVVKLADPIEPICDGDTLTIYVTPGYETYAWSPDIRIIGLAKDSTSVYPNQGQNIQCRSHEQKMDVRLLLILMCT